MVDDPTSQQDSSGDAAAAGADAQAVDEEVASIDEVTPVRRPRRAGRRAGRGKRARAERAAVEEPQRPSLAPVLLSGRSLEAPPSDGPIARLRRNRGRVALVVLLVVVVAVVVGGRQLAVSAADSAMEQRSDELEQLLDGATPEDFLAFGVAVQQDGSLAQRVRDLDGFVNVRANADYAFMRFQPSEWWSGFTERCLVAVVRDDGVRVETPRTRCLRVPEPTQ